MGKTKTSILLYNFYSWRVIFTTFQESQYSKWKIYFSIFGFVFIMLKQKTIASQQNPLNTINELHKNSFALQNHTPSALRQILHAQGVTVCHCRKLPFITKEDEISAGPIISGCLVFYHLTTNFLLLGRNEYKSKTFYLSCFIFHIAMKNQEFWLLTTKSSIKLQSRKPYSHPVTALLGLRLVAWVVYFFRVCVSGFFCCKSKRNNFLCNLLCH